MTDQKPNCGNCPHQNKISCPYDEETAYYSLKEWMNLPEGALRFTKVVGCLSHSNAKAYLMKDVIVELERLSNQNVGSQYKYALTEAISLIKEGAKKE